MELLTLPCGEKTVDEKAWDLLIDKIDKLDKRFDKMDEKVEAIQKFRWIHAGVIASVATAITFYLKA